MTGWSLGLAIAALGVSFVSAIYSIRTYHRAGVRVELSAERGKLISPWGGHFAGSGFAPVVQVTLTNKGLAATQVQTVFFDVEGRDSFVALTPTGPEFPARLDGSHSLTWAVAVDSMYKGAKLAPETQAQVRAGATLGNGTKLQGEWFTLTRGVDE